MSWTRPVLRRSRERASRSRPGAGLRELIAALPEERRANALRHSSWTEERIDSYERLALLGDSVLGLAVASLLYRDLPDLDAGELTKILNQAVSGASCAEVGRELGIPEMLMEAAPPEGDGRSTPAGVLLEGERPLPEMTEAMIGACFLEFGFEATAAAVAGAFGSRIETVRKTRTDFKSALQETLAKRGGTVTYEVIATTGPAHERTYEVAAVVEGREIGRGAGRSKKAAGQAAAQQGLESLEQ